MAKGGSRGQVRRSPGPLRRRTEPGQRGGGLHGADAGALHRQRRQRAKLQDVSLRVVAAGGEREDGVAVHRRVHRPDRARQPRLRDHGEPVRLLFAQHRVRGDDSDRAVLRGERRQRRLFAQNIDRATRTSPGLSPRGPATICAVSGSTTSPQQLTTTSAPMVIPEAVVSAAVPMPPFSARSMPSALPTVAPVPAPTLPSAITPVVAASHAA